MVKNVPANAGDSRDVSSNPGSGRSPGVGNGNAPVFLPGKFHGQRSLVGHSPQGCKELDTTEQLSTHTHTTSGLIGLGTSRKFSIETSVLPGWRGRQCNSGQKLSEPLTAPASSHFLAWMLPHSPLLSLVNSYSSFNTQINIIFLEKFLL